MNEDEELILYCDARFCSPWVLTVWAALQEKRVPFKPVLLNLERSENRRGDFPVHTLASKVPTLRLGDFWLSESQAILEFLEERFPAPKHRALLPADMQARAEDRAILSWLRTDLLELRRCLPYEGIFLPLKTPAPTTLAGDEAEALIHVATTRMAAPSKADPTLADAELAYTLRRLIHYRFHLNGHERLIAWSDATWNRPSAQSWVRQNRSAFGGEDLA